MHVCTGTRRSDWSKHGQKAINLQYIFDIKIFFLILKKSMKIGCENGGKKANSNPPPHFLYF